MMLLSSNQWKLTLIKFQGEENIFQFKYITESDDNVKSSDYNKTIRLQPDESLLF